VGAVPVATAIKPRKPAIVTMTTTTMTTAIATTVTVMTVTTAAMIATAKIATTTTTEIPATLHATCIPKRAVVIVTGIAELMAVNATALINK